MRQKGKVPGVGAFRGVRGVVGWLFWCCLRVQAGNGLTPMFGASRTGED